MKKCILLLGVLVLFSHLMYPSRPGYFAAEDLVAFGTPLMGEAVVKKFSPIVHLYVKTGYIHPKLEFTCTGFVVDDRYLLTAAHCVEGPDDKFYIRANGKGSVLATLTVAGYNDRMDYAILTGDLREFIPLPLETRVASAAGTEIVELCGYPGGQESVLCLPGAGMGPMGFRVAVGHTIAYPGMSGGPVMDMQSGIVVGIISAVVQPEHTFVQVAVLTGILGDFGIESSISP